MRKMLVALSALLVVAATAVEVGEAGPELLVKPINVEGEAYEAMARSKGELGVCFINPGAVTEEAVGELIGYIAGIHEGAADEGLELPTLFVVVGDPALEPQVKAYLEEVEITVPTAIVPADQLKAWKLPEDLKALFYSFEEGKCNGVFDNYKDLEKALGGAEEAM
ncbi:MAG: hypothetical protein HUU35_07570 [Armatimonadetes bacterium]|nr:hypothetical protein [Armatimonadota bacterium]